MGRKEEGFVRAIAAGATWKDAAREVGLPEKRAAAFLESVATFAGSVSAPMEFGLPDGGGADRADAGAATAPRHDEVVIYTDGASKGNPGPAGAGGVILTPSGETIEEFREHLGQTTNNVAEYEAVRIGLVRALALGARRVTVRLDSELVSNQLTGRYKVKDAKLLDRYLEVVQLLSRLDSVRFETIPREKNDRADRLAQTGARMGR
ncbi:MAG: ribonuclease HI family protein [Candidatus Eisenbacteria bacterium]